MMLDVEQYRRGEESYGRAVAEFEELKRQYDSLYAANPEDPSLPALYAALEAKQKQLEKTREALQSMRRDFASSLASHAI